MLPKVVAEHEESGSSSRDDQSEMLKLREEIQTKREIEAEEHRKNHAAV